MRRALTRTLAGPVLAVLTVVTLGACDRGEIRTVDDFDAHPCGLITGEIMTGAVVPAYRELARADPTLLRTRESTAACTYFYDVPGAVIPQLRTFTVTLQHDQGANQPLALCLGGATSRTAGYTVEPGIGDAACLSPTADLWLRVGQHYFHVVVVPQPGFADPVDRLQATAPLTVAVATSAADRLPRT